MTPAPPPPGASGEAPHRGAAASLVRFECLAEPGTDRAHRPAGPFAHEAWSLAVSDESGGVALFVTLAARVPFGPGNGGAFSLLLAKDGAPAARFLERHPADAVSAEGPILHVRVGENTLTGGRDHNLTLFELHLDETRPGSRERVRGDLLLQLPYDDAGRRAPFPASRPAGPVAAEEEEVWTCLAADAIVRGVVVVEDRRGVLRHRAEIRGRGAIEHTAGLSQLRRSLRFAVRSTLHRDDLALFLWHATPSGSSAARTGLLLTERGRPLLSLDAASLAAPAGNGRLPESIDCRVGGETAGARVRHAVERVLERGPHFLRFRPDIRVEATIPGRGPLAFEGTGLSEAVFPPRLGRSLAGAIGATRWRDDRSGAGLEPGPPSSPRPPGE